MSASPRTAAILRLFPSLTDIAFLTPALLMLTRPEGLNMLLGDGDTGWHIRTGEWILANGRVPQTDMFSFTRSGEPWFAWEWLADILMAAMHLRFGMAGVMFLSIVLVGIASVLLFRLCRRHTNNDLLAMACAFLASAASSIHWLARPHLFTLVFVVISLHLLDRAAENRKLLWIFPPMVALWTNLHGAFFVSIILLGAAGTGRLLQVVLGPENNGLRAGWNEARTYYAAAAASAAASLANPYGWHLHQHIVKYLSEKYHFENISEFQTLSFHAPAARYFEILVVLGLLAAAWSVSRRRYTDMLLVLGWLHLAFIAARNIPIFAIVAAPVVTSFVSESVAALQKADVAAWLRRLAAAFESSTVEFNRTDRMPRLHLTSLAGAALLFVLLLGAPADTKKFRSAFDPERYPEGALSLLEGKRVFTDDEWGDYLIYKLYPSTKVFVDGRSDFYGPEFCQKFIDVMKARWDWTEMLTRYRVDAVLLQSDSPLATALKSSAGWRPVYDDHRAILFFASEDRPAAASVSSAALRLMSDAKPGPLTGSPSETAVQPKPQL